MRIGIVDTGIDPNHPWLSSCDIEFWSAQTTNSIDQFGHGTSVATLLHSICPSATLLSAKISGDPTGPLHNLVPESTIAAGIEWCVKQDARIINVSYGLPRADGAIQEACDFAARSGVIMVAAYSNESESGFPAQLPNVIGVKRLRDGALGDLQIENHKNLDVLAFGGPMHVGDKQQGYSFIGGTSLSAAHVSGLLGRLLLIRSVCESREAFDLLMDLSTADSPIVEDCRIEENSGIVEDVVGRWFE